MEIVRNCLYAAGRTILYAAATGVLVSTITFTLDAMESLKNNGPIEEQRLFPFKIPYTEATFFPAAAIGGLAGLLSSIENQKKKRLDNGFFLKK